MSVTTNNYVGYRSVSHNKQLRGISQCRLQQTITWDIAVSVTVNNYVGYRSLSYNKQLRGISQCQLQQTIGEVQRRLQQTIKKITYSSTHFIHASFSVSFAYLRVQHLLSSNNVVCVVLQLKGICLNNLHFQFK